MDPTSNVDDILRALGKYGKYQRIQYILLCFAIWSCGFQLLSGIVTGYRPHYECVNPYKDATYNNGTDQYNRTYTDNTNKDFPSKPTIDVGNCDITITLNMTNGTTVSTEPCQDGYVYSLPRERSFVTEWDLVCKGAERAEFSQTLVMAGQMLGASFFASLSDRIGRKKINVFSNFGLFTVGLGIAYAPNYMTFAVLRFFLGALQQGLVMTNTIMMLELLPEESRYLSEINGSFLWSTGVCFLAGIGYLMRNYSWRTIQIVLSIYSGYSVLQVWIQDESLRWLMINNKKEEAERIIRKAAKMNNVKYEDVMKEVKLKQSQKSKMVESDKNGESEIIVLTNDNMRVANIHDYNDEKLEGTCTEDKEYKPAGHTEFKVEHYNATYIFREKRILLNSLILWLLWVTDSLTYFSLMLTSSSLAGNRFLNFFLMAFVEYPSLFIQYLCFNRIGRKGTCILFHMLAGVSLAVATVCNTLSDGQGSLATVSTVFFLLGKMAITGAFSTMFLYTPEMYPTNLRNVGIGLSSSMARIGGMIAPFAGIMANYVSWGPGAIFGTMCFLVSFLCTFLPETMGHELPKTIEELKLWYKEHSGGSRRKKRERNLK